MLELWVAIFILTSDNLSSMCLIVYGFVVESILHELSSPPSVLIVYGLLILLDVASLITRMCSQPPQSQGSLGSSLRREHGGRHRLVF
jgi:hypothetical protein